MKKKIVTILALTLCLLLCACGNDSDANTDKNTETTSDTSDVTTGTSETESETTDEPVDATVSGTWTDMFCIINGHKVTFPCKWSDLIDTEYVTANNFHYNVSGKTEERQSCVWGDEWRVDVYAYNVHDEIVVMTESPNIYMTGFWWEKDRTVDNDGSVGYTGTYCEDFMLPGGIKTTFTAKEVEDVYGAPDTVLYESIVTYYDETTGVKLEITYDWYNPKYTEQNHILEIRYRIDPEISGVTNIEPVEEPKDIGTDENW